MNAIKAAGFAALAAAAMIGCTGLTIQQKIPKNQQDVLFRDMQNQPAAYRAYQCPGLVIVEQK